MNKNEIKIQETGLLNDERITRFMQGQMNVDEESAFMAELKNNEVLRSQAIAQARLVKGMKQVDDELKEIIRSTDEQTIRRLASETTIRKKQTARWLAIAASVALILFVGFKSYDYYNTTSLGKKYAHTFPVSSIVRGEANLDVEAELTTLFNNIAEGKDLDDTISRLEALWEISKQETYNDYTDYAPYIGWNLAIGYLQEIAEGKYGFRPSYLGEAHGLLHLFAYCECTLDPSLYLLKDVLGQAAYEAIKEQGGFDVYRELCRFFSIENPPPSLRKAYVRNPESILVYVFLRQCGFTDINIIRRFFYREEIFGYRLLDMRYDTITEALSFSGAGAYEIRSFQRFCRWLLRYRSEKAIAPRVLRWCNDNLNYAAMDTLRMFVEAGLDNNEGMIDQSVYRRLLNEGLTQEVHDALVDELFIARPDIVDHYRNAGVNPKRENKIYEYKEKELALETSLGEYTFHLPKDTNELHKWGNLFHNCVASYDSDVLSKWSLIAAMKKKEKYVACIEVKQGRITQALGYCNQRLPADYRAAIAEWANRNKIFYRH